MNRCRLHIFGASGTGTTTLGRALADHWSVPHADTDDYFWEPTDPPFQIKRVESERLPLMESIFLPRKEWVLTGSLMGWGDPLIKSFDAAVFLTLDLEQRMLRLEAREAGRRSGREAINLAAHEGFMAWAASYDDPSFEGRSRTRHEAWISELACPVLRLDTTPPAPTLVEAVLDWDPTA